MLDSNDGLQVVLVIKMRIQSALPTPENGFFQDRSDATRDRLGGVLGIETWQENSWMLTASGLAEPSTRQAVLPSGTTSACSLGSRREKSPIGLEGEGWTEPSVRRILYPTIDTANPANEARVGLIDV